jgi:hypothetical protein
MLTAWNRSTAFSQRLTRVLHGTAVSCAVDGFAGSSNSAQAPELRQGNEFVEEGCYARLSLRRVPG